MTKLFGCLGTALFIFFMIITAYTDPILGWMVFTLVCIIVMILIIGAIADAIKRGTLK